MSKPDADLKKFEKRADVSKDLIGLAVPALPVRYTQNISPEEIAILFGREEKTKDKRLGDVVRIRDVLKKVVTRPKSSGLSDPTQHVLFIGFENQTYDDYGMLLRTMLEDAINYIAQAEQFQKRHARQGEYSEITDHFGTGMLPDDKVYPILTIVIYWSSKKWEGPRTLHELINFGSGLDKDLIPANTLHLIEPARLTDAQINSCKSSLREVLLYIRAFDNEEALTKLLKTDKGMRSVDIEAARVIAAVTGTKIQLSRRFRKGDKVNMSNAIEAMIDRRTKTLQTDLRDARKTIEQQDRTLVQRDQTIEQQGLMLVQRDQMIEQQDQTIEQQGQMLVQRDQTIEQQDQTIEQRDQTIEQQGQMIVDLKATIAQLEAQIAAQAQ